MIPLKGLDAWEDANFHKGVRSQRLSHGQPRVDANLTEAPRTPDQRAIDKELLRVFGEVATAGDMTDPIWMDLHSDEWQGARVLVQDFLKQGFNPSSSEQLDTYLAGIYYHNAASV